MQRGDIHLVNLPTQQNVPGHEQFGTRPALIVQSNRDLPYVNVVMIVPITGQLTADRFPHTIPIQPTQENGLSRESLLLVFQLRALDRKRISRKIGQIEPGLMAKVDTELRLLLDL